MAVRTVSTSIKLDGEAEFKKQMSLVNSELKTLKTEMQYTEESFKGQANTMEALTAKNELLRRELEQQTEKVKALENAVKESSEAFGDNDKRTDEWRQSLNRAKTDLLKLNGELDDNERYLDEARSSADKCAKSIDGFGKEAKDAAGDAGGLNSILQNLGGGGGLSGLLDGLGGVKGLLAGGAVGLGVDALKEMGGAIIDLEESTREYRQIMGALDVSSQQAGYTAEQTADAYNRLYGVLGDTQTTATTVANLQAIGLSQEDLMTVIDQATGAWATYGDSIPIDSLAESINETIQAGTVTGTFADVLNWAGASEDAFNEKLAATSDKSERANLVMDQLSKQGLAAAGQAYRDLNEDVINANDSQRKLEEAWGKLGEALEPVASFLRDVMAGALTAVAGAAENLVGWVGKAYDKLTDFLGLEARESQLSAQINGSHAGGLDRVPYNGYVAQLHQDEAVLTAQEARVWRSIQAGSQMPQQGVTAEQMQTMLTGAVNAMGALQQSRDNGPMVGEITVRTEDGTRLGRWLVPFSRSEDKSNPEVVSDR